MLDALLRLPGPWPDRGLPAFIIDAVTWLKRDVSIVVRSVDELDRASEPGSWTVRCRNVSGLRLIDRTGGLRVLGEECPVVRQFLVPTRDLTFHGDISSPDATAWGLLSAHRRVTEDWIPMDEVLNPHADLMALLEGRFGKLAEGPDFIVEALRLVLIRAGVTATVGPPQPPRVWFDGAWLSPVAPLHGIAIGRTWIVAGAFEVQRNG